MVNGYYYAIHGTNYFQINLYLTDLQLNKFDGVFMVNSKYNYLTISY